jgi:hypothetical protein
VSPDTKLVVVFGALHLVGLGLVGGLLVFFLRTDTIQAGRTPEDDDTGGGGPPVPKPPRVPPSPGGLPLPDAAPSPVRLREPGRLADVTVRRQRRPVREPQRPAREREPR